VRARRAGGGHVERFAVRCEAGLVGKTVTIDGLPTTRTDVLARVIGLDGTTQTARLTPERPSFAVTGTAGWREVVTTYTVLGVEHILLGIDHLLFVLALLFLVGSVRRLIATVTAFTVAHSLTLASATLGWLHVPQAPVEASIALSIVLVAVEVLAASRGRPHLGRRRPWLVAFAFGLLHGLGFAGALREVGLPDNAIPLALLFFNIGVEVGQIAFVLAVVAFLQTASALLGATDLWGPARRAAPAAAYGIGMLAAYWLIERTLSFWT
jgi:hydrogenase/urease accessory protein HupE